MVLTKQKIVCVLILMIVLALSVGVQIYRFGSHGGKASVWVFNVGQGDAIFIDADYDVIVDGGPSDMIVEKMTVILPFWDRSIDLIVNTHPHADHLTGLIHVLNRYLVGEVWVSGQVYQTRFAGEFEDLFGDRSLIATSGQWLQLDQEVLIRVLWPVANLEGIELDDPNDGSIVLLVECFETRILLTGDIGAEQELAIMNQAGDIDVLKVSHQGSNTSSHIDFLNATDPEVAIISVGENDYGHPHEGVLNRLNQIGVQIYRTDLHGDVRVICSEDGYEIKVY